jgi:integrase
VICHTYKRKGRRLWRGRFKLTGQAKLRDVPLRTTDKQVAQQRLLALIREFDQERAGLVAPRPLREAADQKLVDHLDDFIRSREGCGCDDDYTYNLRRLISRVFRECRWVLFTDVTAKSFEQWRRQQHKAPRTLNEYLESLHAFFRWLIAGKKLLDDPLAQVGKVEESGEERRLRRALSAGEVDRLLAVSGARAIVYLFALFTGLRRGELALLTWADVSLDAEQPFVHVRASISKNHKDADLPLHAQLVAALRARRPPAAQPADRVFPRMPSMYQYKADLKAAGIDYKDSEGRQADFHALRHTYGTNLWRAGLLAPVVKELRRHSDLRLTLRYTDVKQLATAGSIDRLPAFGAGPQLGPQKLGAASHGVSRPVTAKGAGDVEETPENTAQSHDLTQAVAGCHKLRSGCLARTRT